MRRGQALLAGSAGHRLGAFAESAEINITGEGLIENVKELVDWKVILVAEDRIELSTYGL